MKLILLLPLLLLAACSGTSERNGKEPLLPLESRVVDPTDAELKESVKIFLTETKAPAASRYKVVRHDLNNDGRRDALVLFEAPYGYWCGSHGCTMLVMKAKNEDFSLVNSIQPVREPVYISPEASNGWKDIMVRVSGRWSGAKNVAMKYDGREYPMNPDEQPPLERLATNTFTRVFNR